jgi:hypothetical protein
VFILRVFDQNYKEIGTIERKSVHELIALGKRLEADFAAYWRLDVHLEGVYICL